MFTGFSEETVDFMWGIRFNNEKSWFEAHKEQYLTCLQAPMRELCGEMYAHIQAKLPDIALMGKTSRIYRDARRLFGRGPYKDHLWFSVSRPVEEVWTDRPSFWFELTPDGWDYGMGYWVSRPVTMAKLRARIDREPEPITRLTAALDRQREFSLHTVDYKKPRSQAPLPLLEPWYQAKYFSIGHEEKLTEELFSREIVERLKAGFDFLIPYFVYFDTLSGEPDPRE